MAQESPVQFGNGKVLSCKGAKSDGLDMRGEEWLRKSPARIGNGRVQHGDSGQSKGIAETCSEEQRRREDWR